MSKNTITIEHDPETENNSIAYNGAAHKDSNPDLVSVVVIFQAPHKGDPGRLLSLPFPGEGREIMITHTLEMIGQLMLANRVSFEDLQVWAQARAATPFEELIENMKREREASLSELDDVLGRILDGNA